MHKPASTKLPADDRLVEIELLFQTALNELRKNKETDVDFKHLFGLVEIYHKFYEPVESNDKRWRDYTEELLSLLADSHEEVSSEIKQMIDTDKPMRAYQKAVDASHSIKEE